MVNVSNVVKGRLAASYSLGAPHLLACVKRFGLKAPVIRCSRYVPSP
jgi:hypothetical protein